MIKEIARSAVQMLAAAGLATAAVFFGTYAYYEMRPIETWIDYRSVTPHQRKGVEMIRVIRKNVEKDIFIIRLTELQEVMPNQLYRYCQWAMTPATDGSLRDVSNYPIREFVGPVCDLSKLEGKTLMLFVVFDVTLPFDIHKRKPFLVGPYRVKGGELRYVGVRK